MYMKTVPTDRGTDTSTGNDLTLPHGRGVTFRVREEKV